VSMMLLLLLGLLAVGGLGATLVLLLTQRHK
jgi:hypothetical protein